VLVDSTGVEEALSFHHKQEFNRWIQANNLTHLLPDGKEVVAAWERLEEGDRYFTDKKLDKRVRLVHAAND
jgi:hypothetical protein